MTAPLWRMVLYQRSCGKSVREKEEGGNELGGGLRKGREDSGGQYLQRRGMVWFFNPSPHWQLLMAKCIAPAAE